MTVKECSSLERYDLSDQNGVPDMWEGSGGATKQTHQPGRGS